MITVSALLHATVIARFRIPDAVPVPETREIMVTLTVPVAEEPAPEQPELLPEPEPIVEDVVVAAEPVPTWEPAPLVPTQTSPPDAGIPPMDPTHSIPITTVAVTPMVTAAVATPTPGNPPNESIVRSWLERHKHYPRVAVVRRMEGEVILFVHLDASGQVIDVRIEESSGFKILDDEVLAMVRRASPFPLMTNEATSETIYYIPVDFNLE